MIASVITPYICRNSTYQLKADYFNDTDYLTIQDTSERKIAFDPVTAMLGTQDRQGQ